MVKKLKGLSIKENRATKIEVSDISIAWDSKRGTCTFESLPVTMMWIDTTLAGLMSGMQAMVGTKRFGLALQSEGRKSVDADWTVISQFSDFREGFRAISNIAAVAGWGDWKLISLDMERKQVRFRIQNSWEGRYQKALGVCWGSSMLAGKMAGYCSKLFGANCWANQSAFIAKGDEYDEFMVGPSERSIEQEIENLLATDESTRADLAVALRKLKKEMAERTQAEEALQESEERLRAMGDALPDLVFILDEDGRYVEVLTAESNLLYKEAMQMKGRLMHEVLPESKADLFLNTVRRTIDTHESQILEYDLRVPAGHSWFEGRTALLDLRVNGKQVVVFIARDITKSKLAEDALQQRESLLRATLDATADGILVVNESGQVTHTNARFANMWRIPETLIDTKDDSILIDYVLDQLKEPEAFLTKVKKLYGTADEDFDTLHFKDGRVFERYSCPLLQNGKIKGRVWSFRDVTDRKNAEDEKQRLQAQLQRAERMEAIGMLAGGVAHDLNNVLSGLVSYPDLMLIDLPDDSPLRGPIQTIKSSGQKAASIVQDLLTLARRGVAVTEVTNLNHIVDEYLKSSEYKKLKTHYPSHQIECNLEADLLPILASSVHLSNTIMNLVSNAADAISGEGLIKISTTNRYIDKTIKGYDKVKEGDYVVLTVTDNGVGISPTDLQKIFEPFYTKKVMGRSGTGLGMAVVWGTVKDHNGYIDIESTEGEGTTFNLYFPITREKAEKESIAPSMKEYMGNGEKVLVIDDMKDQREIATTLLSKLGYSVDVASSGEEAVEYVKNNTPDLLILDMIMEPGIDGLDTYKKILELKPNQKAIIASGFSETDRVKKAQALGAGQYVKKPYTLEKIGLAVKTELSR